MLAWLLLSCLAPPPEPDGPGGRLAMLATGTTADTGPIELESSEFVVVVIGQSNAGCNLLKPTPFAFSLAPGGNHEGARFIRNGIELPDYGAEPSGPKYIGPEFAVVDELILSGVPATDITVVERCIPGASIVSMRDTVWPLLLVDFSIFELPPPVGIILWQGEGDARNLQLAQLYQSRLVGDDGQPSLRDVVESQWTEVVWSVVELRVRDPDYASTTGQQLVRSAQHLWGAYDNVCVTPSYDAPLLIGDNQPHTSIEGTELIGRRAVHGLIDPFCP